MRKYISIIYAMIIFFAAFIINFVAAFIIGDLFTRLIMIESELAIMHSVQIQMNENIQLFVFITPGSLLFIYLLTFFKLSLKEKHKIKVLSTALYASLIGSTGWLLSIIINAFAFRKYTGELFYIKSIVMLVVAVFITFMFSYYFIDFINRKFFIKRFFSAGEHLSPYIGKFNLSVRSKFSVLFISITVMPIIFLAIFNLSLLQKFNYYDPVKNLLIIVISCIIVCFTITFFFMRTYKKPLLEMSSVVREIKLGKYESFVKVESVDELGFLAENINSTIISLKEKEFITETFGKMVDPNVRDYLLKGNITLGGEVKHTTVLFSDIRQFTSLSEKMTPAQIVSLLNEYFEVMTKCILDNRGYVNKYIGDAILAVFGDPVKVEDHADAALNAAVSMMRELNNLNTRFKERGLPELKFGIGIHTGEVLAGNIGSSSRMEYTVIGDAVNLASRVEALTKIYGTSALITEDTRGFLKNKNKYILREIDLVRVHGKVKPVTVFEVYDFN